MLKRIEIALKWIIPMIVLCVLYIQIKSDSGTISNVLAKINFNSKSILLIIALIVFMILNWLLESLKWKILIDKITEVSLVNAVKSILNGLAFGLFTPFRIGDVVTRIAHLTIENRSYALGSVFVARSSQLVTTVVFGLAGSIYFVSYYYGLSIDWLWAIIVVTIWIYYNVHKLIPLLSKINVFSSYIKYVKVMESYSYMDFTIVLLIGLTRYAVIIFQYWLMFQFFNIAASVQIIFIGVTVTLFIKSILPIISVIGDFGVREVVAIFVFTKYGVASTEILLVTVSIWILNIVIPSLIGSFLSKNFKLS